MCSSRSKKICKLLEKLPVTERFVFRILARYREKADRCVQWQNVVYAFMNVYTVCPDSFGIAAKKVV